jgi:hypothetical protein
MLRKLTVAVSALVIASGAQAARLTEVNGTVLVNAGEGFREASGKTSVSPGDRVLIRGKGAAQIDYGAGCIERVLANQTVIVASKPICNSTPATPMRNPAAVKQASIPFNHGLEDQSIFIVGGLIVVSSAAAAIAANGNDNKALSSTVKNGPAGAMDASTAAMEGFAVARQASVMGAADAEIAIAFTGGDNEDGTPASP